jgi:hypothetical protein
VDRTWEYIDRSQTHESGNWDGGRAVLFLEYINPNFFAVYRAGICSAVCADFHYFFYLKPAIPLRKEYIAYIVHCI